MERPATELSLCSRCGCVVLYHSQSFCRRRDSFFFVCVQDTLVGHITESTFMRCVRDKYGGML